ncbi:hypothetical protein FRB95_008839 [Tulasnella sp. JGI-2019a]|nr:hypothetical protein FRB95_008839 [Tulasnella sp. JGI-2019a]
MPHRKMDYTTYGKDSDYYFPDGNICISAEKALFRVHRGVLARHSIAFRELFGVPQPTHGFDSFEGVTVVNLPDTLSEIRTLLKFVYGDMWVQSCNARTQQDATADRGFFFLAIQKCMLPPQILFRLPQHLLRETRKHPSRIAQVRRETLPRVGTRTPAPISQHERCRTIWSHYLCGMATIQGPGLPRSSHQIDAARRPTGARWAIGASLL